jgi:hypothetical protein
MVAPDSWCGRIAALNGKFVKVCQKRARDACGDAFVTNSSETFRSPRCFWNWSLRRLVAKETVITVGLR